MEHIFGKYTSAPFVWPVSYSLVISVPDPLNLLVGKLEIRTLELMIKLYWQWVTGYDDEDVMASLSGNCNPCTTPPLQHTQYNHLIMSIICMEASHSLSPRLCPVQPFGKLQFVLSGFFHQADKTKFRAKWFWIVHQFGDISVLGTIPFEMMPS